MPRTSTTIALLTTTILLGLSACSDGDDAATGDTASTATTEASGGTATPASTSPDTTSSTTTPPDTAATTTPIPTTAPATTGPTSTAPATTEPAMEFTPAGPGEYEVGVATITLDDPERPLTVDVWFPLALDTDATALAPQQYTFLPGVYHESPDAYAASAEALATDGPFPLVAYSHGSGGLRYLHAAYTETLASHGYVVAAPDHTGNTTFERIAGGGADPAATAINRPADIRRVIDAMTDATDPAAGAWAASVDATRIAVTGHSLGGFTTMALIAGYSNDLDEIVPDDRITAIVPLAPAISDTAFPADALATVETPMMIVVGTDDITTPVDPNVTWLWDNTTQSPAYRVELVGAEHQSFTDLCVYDDSVELLPDVPEIIIETIDTMGAEGCLDDDMPIDRVNELTSTYVLAFLGEVLLGGPTVDEVVGAAPDDVIYDER